MTIGGGAGRAIVGAFVAPIPAALGAATHVVPTRASAFLTRFALPSFLSRPARV
jgi:hypothetical protein